jgi:hypothetical protein
VNARREKIGARRSQTEVWHAIAFRDGEDQSIFEIARPSQTEVWHGIAFRDGEDQSIFAMTCFTCV